MNPNPNDSHIKLPEWLSSQLDIKPVIRIRTLIFYGITFATLIIIYRHLPDIVLIKDFFAKSNFYNILLLLALQAATYLCIALTYQDVLKIKDLVLPIRELFPITFVIQFLNQALPSATISGQIFFIQYLRQYKVSVPEGISRAILEMAALFSAFGLLFITSLGLVLHEQIVHDTELFSFLIVVFIAIVVLFVLLFIGLQRDNAGRFIESLILRMNDFLERKSFRRIGKYLSNLHTIVVEMRKTLRLRELHKRGWLFNRAIVWQLCVMFLDIATLYLIAYTLGYQIRFSIIFIVFVFSQFLGMIIFVPGAVGVFEGSMTLLFISFGIPAGPALATTLLYRALTFWLPMPFGWLLYRRYTRRLNALEDGQLSR